MQLDEWEEEKMKLKGGEGERRKGWVKDGGGGKEKNEGKNEGERKRRGEKREDRGKDGRKIEGEIKVCEKVGKRGRRKRNKNGGARRKEVWVK